MLVVGLDHVQVAAPRTPDAEEQARAFYGELLGLREVEKPDILKPKGGVWFSLGAGELHIGVFRGPRPARTGPRWWPGHSTLLAALPSPIWATCLCWRGQPGSRWCYWR